MTSKTISLWSSLSSHLCLGLTSDRFPSDFPTKSYTHLSSFPQVSRSRCSVVGILSRLPVGRSRVRIPVGAKDFLPFQNFQTGYGAHPDTELLTLGVERPRREVSHLHSSCAEVKNEWKYTSTSPMRFRRVNSEYFTVLPTRATCSCTCPLDFISQAVFGKRKKS
jgi:hypothetical protein